VPHDDTNCTIFGWRHFKEHVPSLRLGDPNACGVEGFDAVGQSGGRPYEEKQRNPGDWDVLVGQRPIAIHALEHLGTTDKGVAMLRRLLRRAFRGESMGEGAVVRDGLIHSYTQDTVLRSPNPDGSDDAAFVRRIGGLVTAATLQGDAYAGAARDAFIRDRLRPFSEPGANPACPRTP
jgi:tert-butyl alcohol monooxygenase / tert-amyl alcohol desaturase